MVYIAGRGPTLGARTTVGELLERWYAVASPGWAPTTVRQTRSVLNRLLLPHLGSVMVGDLTTADIDTLYTSLRANGSIVGQPLAAGTIQRVHVVLRSALAQAMRWGWIWDNPASSAARHFSRQSLWSHNGGVWSLIARSNRTGIEPTLTQRGARRPAWVAAVNAFKMCRSAGSVPGCAATASLPPNPQHCAYGLPTDVKRRPRDADC
jgi:hypothetical protein